MNTVKIEMNALEAEKHTVISVYKRQLEAFRYIKKELEGVQWSDANYDRLIDSINAIGQALSATLQALTNGDDVFVISELIPLAEEYLEHEKRFPRIK
ncbi:MAG: hypothetical protein IJY39_05805 [Clostridia bacterium]|nr:hypothetical protein [Clostridia bacterium]